ncbi:hypothetical protein N9972_01005 [bacterium]|nr:hypothetical protein [bacterium]
MMSLGAGMKGAWMGESEEPRGLCNECGKLNDTRHLLSPPQHEGVSLQSPIRARRNGEGYNQVQPTQFYVKQAIHLHSPEQATPNESLGIGHSGSLKRKKTAPRSGLLKNR